MLASLLTTWVTFVPCFLFVFLGAPYVERLRNNQHLTAALTGITAAVVGVIANLALFFALHTLFDRTRRVDVRPGQPRGPGAGELGPGGVRADRRRVALLLWRGWSPLRTLGVCALLGAAVHLVSLAWTP